MKEIDFYPEICAKFSDYLISYLPNGSKIHYSYDKRLPQMIEEIEKKNEFKSTISETYIPKLKLDILFSIKLPSESDLKYILLEVKYLEQLTLAEYSQLIGYLQVAKKISIGIIFLVIKPDSSIPLSNDFQEILRTKNLPMEWMILLKNQVQEKFDFKTGISYYVPRNGVEWIDTHQVNGISSFEDLAKYIIS